MPSGIPITRMLGACCVFDALLGEACFRCAVQVFRLGIGFALRRRVALAFLHEACESSTVFLSFAVTSQVASAAKADVGKDDAHHDEDCFHKFLH